MDIMGCKQFRQAYRRDNTGKPSSAEALKHYGPVDHNDPLTLLVNAEETDELEDFEYHAVSVRHLIINNL